MSNDRGGSDWEGPRIGDATLVVFSVIAIVLAAALVSSLGVVSVGGGPGSGEVGPGVGGGGQGSGESGPASSGGSQSDGSEVSVNEAQAPSTARSTTETQDVVQSEGTTQSGTQSPPSTSERPGEPPEEQANDDSSSECSARNAPSGVGLSLPDKTEVGGKLLPPRKIPLFLVNVSPPKTYRQGAYVNYTGSGWADTGEWRSLEDWESIRSSAGGRTVDYQVRLLVGSDTIPTVWRPKRVRVPNRQASLEVSSTRGVRSGQPLPKNTTYVARSSRIIRDRDRLASAGEDYPRELSRRYTQLPPDTPERLERFTSGLTTDAETPYRTAVIVRDWLRTNKAYSLNASHEPGEPVADQFVFEMEKGYCQYFATAMTAMLRTQDVPARYVVGYAGGTPIGEGQSLVTSDTAHAWVEVYFPDVGWVSFDPTAAGNMPVRSLQPPYDISLNRSAVAGAQVTVSVEKNGTAVIGAPVLVNGNRVGWTGGDGNVTTQLPYAVNITVTALPPSAIGEAVDAQRTTFQTDRRIEGSPFGSALMTDRRSGDEAGPRFFAVSSPESVLSQAPGTNGTENGSSRTYQSSTNVTVSVSGRQAVGGSIVVTAKIEGVPFRNATVRFAGTPIGTTNGTGRIRVSLTNATAGEHRLEVRRGEFIGGTTVAIAPNRGNESRAANETIPITTSVSAAFGFPLPGGPGTATVTRNGAPVEGAVVTVADRPVGRTDANGTVALAFPFHGRASVTARGPAGSVDSATVDGLYRNGGIVLAAVLSLFAVLVFVGRRFGITPSRLRRAIAAALSIVSEFVTTILVQAAERIVRALAIGGQVARQFGRWLRQVPSALRRSVLDVLSLDPRRFLRRLLAAVRSKLAALFGPEDGSGASGSRIRGQATPEREAANDGRATIRELWGEFVAMVRPPGVATRTPGEIARYAIEHGLPERLVWRLTDAYRDAEYGRSDPDASRLDRVRSALQSLRADRSTGEGEHR